MKTQKHPQPSPISRTIVPLPPAQEKRRWTCIAMNYNVAMGYKLIIRPMENPNARHQTNNRLLREDDESCRHKS